MALEDYMGVSCHACLGNVLAEVQKVNPIHILVKKEELRLGEGICQFYINMEWEEWKLDTVWLVWNSDHHSGSHILQQLREGWLAHWEDAHLQLHHVHHRDIDQMEQDVIMREFCSGSSRVSMAHKLPESLMYSRFLLSSTMTFPWTGKLYP